MKSISKKNKGLLSRTMGKFKNILEQQIYIGYLTYIALQTDKKPLTFDIVSYEDYLLIFKDLLNSKKGEKV